ncbi:hypothetical protein PRIPAC_70903 [Pristionchus pacificus]|uniref:Uncharacterized protein n=1 Tax=Pristionchus pacificus TaxID=54126 RepID=A0A2A6CF63_PRIPA|nr:hypothetical protein PRIPAC_70903 [Pristionchus pacificus]|eukprot:PDM76756.1 hypothetical protein PRIPAC_42151 [Pristionchus pacificus]
MNNSSVMDDTKWARKVTTWIPYDYANKRGQGRPEERWRNDLKRKIGPDWWSIDEEEWLSRLS